MFIEYLTRKDMTKILKKLTDKPFFIYKIDKIYDEGSPYSYPSKKGLLLCINIKCKDIADKCLLLKSNTYKFSLTDYDINCDSHAKLNETLKKSDKQYQNSVFEVLNCKNIELAKSYKKMCIWLDESVRKLKIIPTKNLKTQKAPELEK